MISFEQLQGMKLILHSVNAAHLQTPVATPWQQTTPIALGSLMVKMMTATLQL